MTDRVSRPRVKPPLRLPSEYLRSGDKPLADLLQSGFSEHTVPALWHRIQGRLYQPPSRARWPLFAAMASAATILVLVSSFLLRSNSPLRLSSGELPAALIAEATPRSVELSDGSSIRVDQQSRLEVVSNDAATFVTALSRGSATFEVNPKAKRRWVVEVGLTSVEVVGTRFTVTRNESEVTVAVTKGLVLVRGDTVPGGQQRLGAGQALRASTSLRTAVAGGSTDKAQGARTESTRAEAAHPTPVSQAHVDDLPLVDDTVHQTGARAAADARPLDEARPVSTAHEPGSKSGVAGEKASQATARA
ncbi:MAG TPA: FecR family protein, partial [Polyangiaceae bacterium]|nr:FecR family protein [Polyangiaceae bacterium]